MIQDSFSFGKAEFMFKKIPKLNIKEIHYKGLEVSKDYEN